MERVKTACEHFEGYNGNSKGVGLRGGMERT